MMTFHKTEAAARDIAQEATEIDGRPRFVKWWEWSRKWVVYTITEEK